MVDCFLSHSANIYHKVQKAVYQGDETLLLAQKYEKVYAGITGWFSCIIPSKPKHLGITNIWNLYVTSDYLTI